MVSKCHNPHCSKKFRYFGDGKLFEFPAASIKESSQLFWLCNQCMTIHTLKRDEHGEVKLVTKASQEHRKAHFETIWQSKLNLFESQSDYCLLTGRITFDSALISMRFCSGVPTLIRRALGMPQGARLRMMQPSFWTRRES